ncbi:MAG: (2Fe-2S)-binding protein [Thiolinea sp.]|mgnify:FL=1|nr:(2Fe-2S)-binding protein [Thiolinea sp.]
MKLMINGQAQELDVDPNMPLLWALRDHAHLTGTKFGCGMAQCGACTVHIDGQAARACVTPVASVEGKAITTIEGVSQSSKVTQALQTAWLANNVPQCGYCQSGQLMSATALLTQKPKPTDEEINSFMSGNICRCATYQSIKTAIKQAAASLA